MMRARFILTALMFAAPAAAQEAAPAPASAPTSMAAPASASAAPQTDRRVSALTARVHLKVVHPDQVRRALAAAGAKVGGHPTRVTERSISLKIPPAELGAFMRGMSDHGLVLEKTLARQDLTETIADLEGRLRSKTEIFAQLRGFFDRSDLQATLDIERNMTELVQEMEGLKGQLRVERDRAQWSVVEVDFQFQPHDRLVYVQSPFEWLNTVDLDRFLSEFGGEH